MDNEKTIRRLIRESIGGIINEIQGRSNPGFQEQLNSIFNRFIFKLDIKSNYEFSPQENALMREEATNEINKKLSQLEKSGVENFSQIIAFPIGNFYVNIGGGKNKITFHHEEEKNIFPYDSFAVIVHEDTFKLIVPIDLNWPQRMLLDKITNDVKQSGLVNRIKGVDINSNYNTPNIIMLETPEVKLKIAQPEPKEMVSSIRPGAIISHSKFGFGKIIGFANGKEFVKVVFPANKGKFYTFFNKRRMSKGKPTSLTFDEFRDMGNEMVEKKFATSFFKSAAE